MSLANKSSSAIALLLGVPFTSIGAIMFLWITPGVVGQTVLIFCQLWLLCLPIIWLLKSDRQPIEIEISRPQKRDWVQGVAIGLVMFALILAIYWLCLQYDSN